jgi:hypothetical protein
MSLTNEKTAWFFLSGSSSHFETRHIDDIGFGISCLESRGISDKDIFVFIDGPSADIHSQLSLFTSKPYSVNTTDNFLPLVSTNSYDNIIIFVTGHGSVDGIDTQTILKPYPLISAIKNAPGIKTAIVFLGQCYAGTFNYMQAGGTPSIVIIGATNLFLSMSNETTENGITWAANAFLLNLFHWIRSPVDIDGDGKLTIMDAYKFAGAFCNQSNIASRRDNFFAIINARDEIKAKIAEKDILVKTDPTSPQVAVLVNIINTLAKNCFDALGNSINHQEAWILNAVPPQSIEL